MRGPGARRRRTLILFAVALTTLSAGTLAVYATSVPPADGGRALHGPLPASTVPPVDRPPATVAPPPGAEPSPEPAAPTEDDTDDRAPFGPPALSPPQASSDSDGDDEIELALSAGHSDTNVDSEAGQLRLERTSGEHVPHAASAANTGGQVSRVRGSLLTDPVELPEPSDRVLVDVRADVPEGSDIRVDVRSRQRNGGWSEWIPAHPDGAARFESAVEVVQVRVTLLSQSGASPVVHSVSVEPASAESTPSAATPEPSAAPSVSSSPSASVSSSPSASVSSSPSASASSSPQRTPSHAPSQEPTSSGRGVPEFRLRIGQTYRVFATREGLVGQTTANGHTIQPRDHFVALPSGRSLSPRGTGDYTVKVCADNGRCEFAPVWDIGPWNTRDDYWNPPDVRQSWPDLPQGLPEAEAAYLHGYNNGRDQFGRLVSNPAGIDLADGTFWDGLRLQGNSWVTVTYLWTGEGPFGTVHADLLHIRTAPNTRSRSTGYAAQHAQVPVQCFVRGQLIRGPRRATNKWLLVGPDRYISAAFVTVPPQVEAC